MAQEYKETISRYEIDSILGKGGMGTVYKAKDPYLDKFVAVKVFDSLIKNDASKVRFQNEAKTLQKIQNASIPEVYNFGITDEDQLYLVMEYIEGLNLKRKLANEGALPIVEAVYIAVQVCDALGYAHSLGVFHRDLKPENIVLQVQDDDTNKVKVIDFGIAKQDISDEAEQELTITGQVLGSPPYMSPEQINAVNIDGRSDIYSLGCVLFEILTGEKMFEGNTPLATITMHVASEAPLLSSVDKDNSFAQALVDIVARCVKKAPEDRYQNMMDLKSDLLKFISTEPNEIEEVEEISNQEKEERVAENKIFDSPNNKLPIIIVATLLVVSLSFFLKIYFSSHSDTKQQEFRKKPSTLVNPYSTYMSGSVIILENGTVEFNAMVDDRFMKEKPVPPSKTYKFNHCLITSEGFKNLPVNIESLELDGIKFDSKMPNIIVSRFKNLRKLTIYRCEDFSSNALNEFAKCDNLLSLDYLKREPESVLNNEVAEIIKIKSLKQLVIQGRKLGPPAFLHLQKKAGLVSLGIYDANLTKECLEEISKLKELKKLTILNSTIEPDALLSVSKMNLNELAVSRELTQKEKKVLNSKNKLRINYVENRKFKPAFSTLKER